MDFAKKQLLKYGWSEGKGLGKTENGAAQPLNPQLKFNTTGVGYDQSEQFTFNWWENMYNQAADNIKVEKEENGSVKLKLKSEDSIDITTKKYSYKSKQKVNNLEYGTFLKTSKLTPNGIVDHEEKVSLNESPEKVKVKILNDEELFAACGGRTAHKGARHGLKLNGKLTRIEEQEIRLLQKMKKEASKIPIHEHNVDNKYSMFEDEEKEAIKNLHKKKKEAEDMEIDGVEFIEFKKKEKKSKKRTYSEEGSEEDVSNYIDEETARKRTEYFCRKQKNIKKKSYKKRGKKQMDKMSSMLENICVLNSQENNRDDGFSEQAVDEDNAKGTKRKHKKKKRKLNEEKSSEDDGFEECINEVNEKLIHYKELRKDLEEEKRKGDEKRITSISEKLDRSL